MGVFKKVIQFGQNGRLSTEFFMCSVCLQRTVSVNRTQVAGETNEYSEAQHGGWDYVLKGPCIHE